jgi:hypothetical protein
MATRCNVSQDERRSRPAIPGRSINRRKSLARVNPTFQQVMNLPFNQKCQILQALLLELYPEDEE